MIDKKLIDNVHRYDTFRDDGGGKGRVLGETSFTVGQPAEYAIVMGCSQPEAMPCVLRDLRALHRHLGGD